jgi:hydroxymethylpyrimidine/phosphomethylpyrimidine kinase
MENAQPSPGPPRTYRRVLTIAGSDSGGGAGIQADLKTFAALGCYGMSAVTALTAQNTVGVSGIHPVPPAFAAAQIAAVLGDIGADAVKIGMLYSAELIRVVAEQLRKFEARNIVLDPVMVAQSGDRLLQADAVGAMTECLMPLADILTPNIPEAEALVSRKIESLEDMRQAARDLGRFGSRSVLVKGGHRKEDDSSDVLYLCREDRFERFTAGRVDSRNTHGTGCTLSSAIAACLAGGDPLEDAVRRAKEYTGRAIRAGSFYTLGRGNGPVHHFFNYWV